MRDVSLTQSDPGVSCREGLNEEKPGTHPVYSLYTQLISLMPSSVLVQGFYQKTMVIGHQAPARTHANRSAGTPGRGCRGRRRIVVEKDIDPGVTTRHDMMERAFVTNAQRASHCGSKHWSRPRNRMCRDPMQETGPDPGILTSCFRHRSIRHSTEGSERLIFR